jgi:hypothetical protein
MKNRYILPVLIILFFSNCEKVIDLEVPSIEPKLIIDASFEVMFDQNPIVSNNSVKLRLSADYFEDVIPIVTDATVFLTNLSNNEEIPFSDANADGDYEPLDLFIPLDEVEYELTVIYNNETYKGKATKVKTSKLIAVEQGEKSLFSGDEIELKISFQDNEALENYYLFNIDTFDHLAIEDRYFDGSIYNFSYFYENENIEFPKSIPIKLSGITKEYFTYFRVLIAQSGQNAGGPFQSAPSSLLGNITNTTNEANFPLGYFHISETDILNLELVEKN